MTDPNPRRRSLTGGALRSAASQFVAAAAGAITLFALARILGPGRTGAYSVAFSFALGLFILGSLSLQTAIGYLVGSGRWAPRRALFDTQLVAVGFGLALFAIGLGVYAVFRSAFRGLDMATVAIAAVSAPFALSWSYSSAVALAVDRYEIYALAAALQSALSLVLVLPLAAVDGVRGAVLGLTVSHIACAAIILNLCMRAVPPGDTVSRGTSPRLMQAVTFGLKSHGANALTFITYRLDIFILNGNVGAAEVGRYAIAVSVTQGVWLLPNALSAVVLPRVAQLTARPEESDLAYQDIVERKGVRHALIAGIVSGVCLLVALVALVLGFLGSRFHESIALGSVLLPGSVLLAVTVALTSVLAGRGRPTFGLIVSVAMCAAALLLYLLLIPALGAMGAALGSTLAYTLGFAVSVVVGRRMLETSMRTLILPTRAEFRDYLDIARTVRRRRGALADS